MTIELNDPVLERLIADHIQSGRFNTPLEVVVAALASMQADEEDEFDDETVASLEKSFAQTERGETVTIDEAARLLGVSLTPREGKTGAA